MEAIRIKPRNFKKVTTPEGLEHVFKKYVNLQNVFLKDNGDVAPLRVVEMNDDLTLLVRHENVIKGDSVHLFTILSRYLGFDADVIERRENNGDGMHYLLKVTTCHIAQDVRESERYNSTGWDMYVGHMTTLKVVENPESIMRGVSSQLFFKECEKSLESYGYRKIFFANQKDLPGEARFAHETKTEILVGDLADTAKVFDLDQDYFKRRMDVRDDIIKRFAQLNEQYRSLTVRPIGYRTIDGRNFTIGYIEVAADRELGQEDIDVIDAAVEKTYRKIRDANQVVSEERIKVVDISLGGVRLLIDNLKLVQNLSSQEFVLLSLVFKLQQPIRISGSIAYIVKVDEKFFHVGIAFKGSDFGQKVKGLIQSHIEKCRKDSAPH
ncbi:MAG TPA: DUF1577 domain-containing protein [Spirochaetes bacterium]|nr:DUF1577 domain-containing protein [Spirochaetota bacterium]